MTKPSKRREVSARELREMFNSGGYWDQYEEGELTALVLADRHPALPKAREPFCTQSMIIALKNKKGKRIALVHLYLRKDGAIGASGKPDPKRLLVGDTLYYVKEPEKG